ncbi:MAG: ABC transporter ATP-binding protein [Eubacterium sp.]|nr:ABC transporter ATP-binding protein [Eubacterium sp.]
MSVLLQCRKLTKRFGAKEALSQVNLELESGHIIGFLGPNGSGKTTMIKIITGLLQPTAGEILFCGGFIGPESKKQISYLPDQTYLDNNQKVKDVVGLFEDFYADFDRERAYDMLGKLKIGPQERLKTLSKGTKEKVQLIMVMSRKAKLYVLDEPIAGVDPAAREYILNTIISAYEPQSSILLATHLIADVENILDEAVIIKNGQIVRHSSVDEIRMQEGKSLDAYFREVFRC